MCADCNLLPSIVPMRKDVRRGSPKYSGRREYSEFNVSYDTDVRYWRNGQPIYPGRDERETCRHVYRDADDERSRPTEIERVEHTLKTSLKEVKDENEALRKEIKDLRKDIQALQDRTEKMWYAPGMPGTVEARDEFESLKKN